MFDALEVSLQFLERLTPVEERIRQRSAELARQLGPAGESVALNLGEGRLRRAGDAPARRPSRCGSRSRGATSRWRSSAELEALLDRLRAMLFRLTR